MIAKDLFTRKYNFALSMSVYFKNNYVLNTALA